MRKFIPINKKRWFNAARHHFQGGGLWESPYDQPEISNEEYQPQIFNQDINQTSNDTGIDKSLDNSTNDTSSEITKGAGKLTSMFPIAKAACAIGIIFVKGNIDIDLPIPLVISEEVVVVGLSNELSIPISFDI